MNAEMDTALHLYQEGVLHEAYMDDTYTSAVLLLDANDLAAATDQLSRYPMVRNGLIQFQLTPLVGLPAIKDDRQPNGRPLWWPIKLA